MAETLTLEAELEQAKELAERYQFEFIDLRDFRPDLELLRSIPLEYMVRYEFLPLEAPNHSLVIAVADPTDLARLDELEAKLDRGVVVKRAAPSQVRDFLKKTDPSQRVLDKATEEFRLDVIREEENGEPGLSLEEMVQDREVSPMIRLVDSIIFAAIERRASDIHVESRDDSVAVKYRVDGVLQPALAPLAREHQSTLITRIKVMAELDIAERRVPQDGRFRVRYRGRPIDFRVSIMPSINGEDAVLRILDKESLSEKFRSLRLDVLGHSERELKRLRRFIREPYGMVLVTGPTGSGKTTTLYAALSEIKSEEDRIITIEDPVEYQLKGITQIPVNEKKGLTFARGLRSILRHDPDKIMVGEIRDPETANIAVQSALTGHLVFTTVHANNVFDVIGRFMHMNVDLFSFVSALNAILAQRLVRLVCPHCGEEHRPDAALLKESGLTEAQAASFRFRAGRGCRECRGSGYKGRKAIAELMILNDELRELITARAPVRQLKESARTSGTRFLRDAALDAVKNGESTLEEINRVTFI